MWCWCLFWSRSWGTNPPTGEWDCATHAFRFLSLLGRNPFHTHISASSADCPHSCVKHALISSSQIFQASTSGIPSTVGSFQTHQLEVSLRHTSQHKQFGTCDVTSIQPCTRQMPSLLCRFAVFVPRTEITLPRSGMPTDDRTVGKEQRICYQWQRAVMDFSRKIHNTAVKVWRHGRCTTYILPPT